MGFSTELSATKLLRTNKLFRIPLRRAVASEMSTGSDSSSLTLVFTPWPKFLKSASICDTLLMRDDRLVCLIVKMILKNKIN